MKKPNDSQNMNKNSLSRRVLSEQIKEIIIESILNGEFKAGDRVAENTIARKLGVSQAPVRDAIRDLVMLGFLESEAYRGATVRKFTSEELNEVYLIRAALESLGARLAVTRVTEGDAKALRKLLDDMITAALENNLALFVRLDTEFHEQIMKMSGNRHLHQMWKSLQFGYWTLITARTSKFGLEFLARRHSEVLSALLTRDPKKAIEEMENHFKALGSPLE